MPPINPQGNRSGLVTALVVFVILFVVATVFAFSNYGQQKTLNLQLDALKKQYNGFVSDTALQLPQVQALVSAKTEQPTHFGIVNSPAETAMDVAMKQVGGLAGVITGAAADQPASAVADAAVNQTKASQADLKKNGVTVNLSSGGLVGAVKSLTATALNQKQLIDSLTRERDAANDQVQKLTASVAEVTANKDKANQDQAKADAEAVAAAQKLSDDSAATVKQIQADQETAVKKNQDAQQSAMNQVADAQHQLQTAQQELSKVQGRLANRRPDVTNAVVRVADGRIIRVAGNGICYINLGYGTGVTNGLTFEVYDPIGGVPPVPQNVTGDEQLPVGKGSIEIIRVGQNSSECRIVHTEPGAVLTEGDLIENLVYDAHQKYVFDVYGSFDLANTGHPNLADAEVVKRLVTQWGGKLIDHVSPDTDFLVLGAEPVLPEFNRDEMTPENQDKLQKAQAALDAYQEVRQQAVQLHIPIMNQNRFLYYVGYYDQAKQ